MAVNKCAEAHLNYACIDPLSGPVHTQSSLSLTQGLAAVPRINCPEGNLECLLICLLPSHCSTSWGCHLECHFFKPCWESLGKYLLSWNSLTMNKGNSGQICSFTHPAPPELFSGGQRVYRSCSLGKTKYSPCLVIEGRDKLGQLSSRTHVA